MDHETALLLEKAFGKLGVAGSKALETLSGYYLTSAIAQLVIIVGAVALVVWSWQKLLPDIEAEDGSRYDWPTSLVFRTVVVVCASVALFIIVPFELPSIIGTIASPDGYVLTKLIEAVK